MLESTSHYSPYKNWHTLYSMGAYGMHLGSSRNFSASSLLPHPSIRFLFFSSATFTGLHLKVLPVLAESFQTVTDKREKTQIIIFLA